MEKLSPIDKYDVDVYPDLLNDDESSGARFYRASEAKGLFCCLRSKLVFFELVCGIEAVSDIGHLQSLRQYVISPPVSVFNAMPVQMAIRFSQITPTNLKDKSKAPEFCTPPYLIFTGRYVSLYHLPDLPLQIECCFPIPLVARGEENVCGIYFVGGFFFFILISYCMFVPSVQLQYSLGEKASSGCVPLPVVVQPLPSHVAPTSLSLDRELLYTSHSMKADAELNAFRLKSFRKFDFKNARWSSPVLVQFDANDVYSRSRKTRGNGRKLIKMQTSENFVLLIQIFRTGTRKISLYSPYWIVNLTSYALNLLQV
jgi:hypothetical protein